MIETPGDAPPRGDTERARESAYRTGYRSGFDDGYEAARVGDTDADAATGPEANRSGPDAKAEGKEKDKPKDDDKPPLWKRPLVVAPMKVGAVLGLRSYRDAVITLDYVARRWRVERPHRRQE